MNPIELSSEEDAKKLREIPPTQELKINSPWILIDCTKVYEWKVTINSLKTGDRTAYIGILFCKNRKEIGRRIRYIVDSSGSPKEYRIVSAVPSQADNAILAYRVNCEGSNKDNNIIGFPPMRDNVLELAERGAPQEYDDPYTYEISYKSIDLEKNHWAAVGGHATEEAFYESGREKLETLIDLGLKPDSTLLDVGCGTGILIKHLDKYLTSPKNYVGTDLIQDAVEFCKKHYPQFEFFKNEMTSLPKLDRQFDMICLFSVFTHIYQKEMVKFLIEMKAYLKPDGCIVATAFINSTLSDYTGT
jgi:2-polyprenyl-3-methyl-5-hydroxy-6-metoxy-1,4-benzoquinol methylase